MADCAVSSIVCESIIQAMFLLLTKKPFHAITITELTRTAGVSRVSFYRNFQSKEDVLLSYLNDKVQIWWNQLIQENQPDLVYHLFSHFVSMKEELQLLYQAGLSHLLLYNIQNCCGPKPDQPNSFAYWNAWLAGGLFGWVDEWIRRGMQESPEEMASLVTQSFPPAAMSPADHS